jgi:hypothetical protein
MPKANPPLEGDKYMLKHLIAILVIFAVFLVGLQLSVDPTLSLGVWLGRMSWLPIAPADGLPNLCSPLIQLFSFFPLIPFILLLAAGFITLLEMS